MSMKIDNHGVSILAGTSGVQRSPQLSSVTPGSADDQTQRQKPVFNPLAPTLGGRQRELGDTPRACRKTLKKPHIKNPSAVVRQKSHTFGVVANTP